MNGDDPGDGRRSAPTGPPTHRTTRPTPGRPTTPPLQGGAPPDDTTDDVSTLDEPFDDLDPRLSMLFARAFVRPVDVEVAARHLWSIDREGTRLEQQRSEPRGLRRVLVSVVAALALMTTSTAAVAASGPAMPGDLLYPVKRGTEQARLLAARSPEAEALVLLDIASRRVTEAEHAADARPDAVDGLLAEAATAFTAAAAVAVESPDVTAATDEVRQSALDAGQPLEPRGDAAAATAREPRSQTGGRGEVVPGAPPTPGTVPTEAPPTATQPAPTAPQGDQPAVVPPPPIPPETSVPGATPPGAPTDTVVPALPETGTASGPEEPSPAPTPSATPTPSDAPTSVPPPLPPLIPGAPAIPGASGTSGAGERGQDPDAPGDESVPKLPVAEPTAVDIAPPWYLEDVVPEDR